MQRRYIAATLATDRIRFGRPDVLDEIVKTLARGDAVQSGVALLKIAMYALELLLPTTLVLVYMPLPRWTGLQRLAPSTAVASALVAVDCLLSACHAVSPLEYLKFPEEEVRPHALGRPAAFAALRTSTTRERCASGTRPAAPPPQCAGLGPVDCLRFRYWPSVHVGYTIAHYVATIMPAQLVFWSESVRAAGFITIVLSVAQRNGQLTPLLAVGAPTRARRRPPRGCLLHLVGPSPTPEPWRGSAELPVVTRGRRCLGTGRAHVRAGAAGPAPVSAARLPAFRRRRQPDARPHGGRPRFAALRRRSLPASGGGAAAGAASGADAAKASFPPRVRSALPHERLQAAPPATLRVRPAAPSAVDDPGCTAAAACAGATTPSPGQPCTCFCASAAR